MTTNFRADVYSAGFAILAGLFHLGAYWGFWWEAPETAMSLYWRIGVTVVLLVIVAIIVGIISGIKNKDAAQVDERESIVGMKAMRNVTYVYAGTLAIVFMEAFEISDPMLLAHGIIGAFVIGELARMASLYLYLKQGA